MTVNDALNAAERELAASGVDGPRLTAELIMAHVMETGRAGVYARLRDELAAVEAERFFELVERRAGREPLQHITGRQEFFGLDFEVTPDTLVPRPETELVVTEALKRVAGTTGALVADIGTGSGCIAVAVAVNAPGAIVYAVDVSGPALAVAGRNAGRHGVADRVRSMQGDLLGPLAGMGLEGRLDVIVSNPPYIPAADIPGLQPEVQFDPDSALDGGPDGLDVVRRILRDAPAFLKPGGALLVEVGAGQSDAVMQIVSETGGMSVDTFLVDFAGIERVLVAAKK
ncbi:MAG TPA: peptide chain release factor N(5)-glutamine methyltransferase [Nitrospirota bacterium]